MAYLLDRDPLCAQGGKIVFDGKEVGIVRDAKIEIDASSDNRKEIDFSELNSVYEDLKLPLEHTDKLSASFTVAADSNDDFTKWLEGINADLEERRNRLNEKLQKFDIPCSGCGNLLRGNVYAVVDGDKEFLYCSRCHEQGVKRR